MIEADKMSYEDLAKLYNDKCIYCNTLEERLQKANKRNDDLDERIDYVLKKTKRIKDKYEQLYEFAEKLCNIIDKRDEDIKELIKVNEELTSVNKQLQDNCNRSIHITRKIIEII